MARCALVVGLSQYPANIGSLEQPPIDAEKIAQILEEHGEYVVKRLPESWNEATNKYEIDPQGEVTSDDLAKALKNLLIDSCQDGQNIDALIYFAGHGLTTINNMGQKQAYLAVSNTQITIKNDQIIKCEDGILFENLNTLIQESQVQNLVLILDCCHSGFFIERVITEKSFSAFGNSSSQQKHRNYYCICACQSLEKSTVLIGDDHSIFSQAVINGLDQVNANDQGKITTERLYDYIQSELSKKGPKFGQTAIKMGWGEGINIISYPIDQISHKNPSYPLFPNNLDALSADQFIGRDDDLPKIHEKLQGRSENRGKPLIITAVAGMSGVGKSELARQYAHQYQQEYAGGICWLAANLGKSQILTDLSAFMFGNFYVQLPAEATNWPTKQIAQYFWQRWQTPGNILLIFDDVKQYTDIQDFLPSDQRFWVLSTSQIDFSNNRQVEPYPLEVLLREKSLELLTSFIGSDRINKEAAIANQLCDFLGDLPLGLDLAGRYLKEFANLPLSAYWQRLQAMKIDHQSLDDANHPNRSEQTKRGVMTAFQVTWERIGEIHPNSQELAVYFSLYAPAPIPFAIDHDNYDQSMEDKEKSLNTLLDWHIMKKVSADSYRLHNLMREFLQKKLTELENGEELKRLFLAEMINVAQQIKYPVTKEIIQNLLPYIEHITEVANNYVADLKTHFIDDLIKPYNRLGRFYEDQGLYNIAQYWREQCLDVAEKNLPADHPDLAISYNELANLYQSQGKYEQAESLFLKAIAIGEKTLSADHPQLAIRYNNLANLYESQGKYEQAESLFLKAIAIGEKTLSADHPQLAILYNNLANLYESQGKYEQAESLYLKAIAIDEKTLSADHPDLARDYDNLAGLYKSQGKYEEAESLYLKAIAIGEKTLSADHPHLAIHYNNLALLYKSQGKYEEAETLYLRAIAIGEKTLSADHPDLATHYNNLAGLYEYQGKYKQAETLYLRAIAIGEKTLSTDHPDLATWYNNLALLYKSQGKYEQAESFFLKAIAIDEKSLPTDHPDLARDYNNLAGLYESQGKYEQAESLYQKAIAIDEKSLPADHPQLATDYNNLAGLYESQGKYEQAEPIYLKALEIFMDKLGIEHPHTQTVANNLIDFWQTAIAEGRAEELKLLHEHPLGQRVLENTIKQE